MDLVLVGQAAGMFAITNIDDMVILAVFFGRTRGHRTGALRVVTGQYLGFGAILAASVAGALGAGLLPEAAIPYLGLLPLVLGLRAAWTAWREHRSRNVPDQPEPGPNSDAVGVLQVAAITFANGGDYIGVYVPVFTVTGTTGMISYIAVFLVGVALWCLIGWYLATRPLVATTLSRWGHLILPVVLITIGLTILIEGGAFNR